MKFIVFDVPEDRQVPAEVGDVLSLEQSAKLSNLDTEEQLHRSMMASRFFWNENGVGFEVIREQNDPVWSGISKGPGTRE
jgi:hypothetical protein